MLILVPHQIHDIFTLSEVFDYVAFNALPLGNDYQLDYEIFENSRATFPYELQREDGHRYGDLLPPEPDRPDILEPKYLKDFSYTGQDIIDYATREHELYQRQLSDWQEKYDDLVEATKSKVFIALKEGRLNARGKLVRRLKTGVSRHLWSSEDDSVFDEVWEEVELPTYEYVSANQKRALEHEAMKAGDLEAYLIAHKEVLKDDDLSRQRFEQDKVPIPSIFWRLEGINWQASSAKSPLGWYDEIYCSAENVFACFSLPTAGEVSVKSIGGFLAIEDNEFESDIGKETTRRGRPPRIDWHAFDVELARLLMSKDAPKKQESLIALMQEWCVSKWGIAPKRTAVLERVAPFKKLMSENAV